MFLPEFCFSNFLIECKQRVAQSSPTNKDSVHQFHMLHGHAQYSLDCKVNLKSIKQLITVILTIPIYTLYS